METNIQVEVPKTIENTGSESTDSQTTDDATSSSTSNTASDSPQFKPETDPSVIVLSIIFITTALILAGFLLREQIMGLFAKKKKKKK